MVDVKTVQYVNKIKRNRNIRQRIMMLLPILAIVVALAVFWWLKLTGITMTSEAGCGFLEHTHNAECFTDTYTCTKAEHVHDTSCYPDPDADLETYEVWEATFSGISGVLSPADKAVAIAES